MSVDFVGIPTVMQNLQRLGRPQTHVVGDALHAEGNRIMNESVRLVPVDTGLLRSTAAVSRPEERGPEVQVELRYGGHGMAPYAATVELDVRMNHPHGGQAHYLQAAVFAATAGFLERIAAPIRAALGAR